MKHNEMKHIHLSSNRSSLLTLVFVFLAGLSIFGLPGRGQAQSPPTYFPATTTAAGSGTLSWRDNPTVLSHDTLWALAEMSMTADLLANDLLGGKVECLEIVLQPRHGNVTVGKDYKVTYMPADGFCNSEEGGKKDKFFYEICMEGGSYYTAVAYVEVACRQTFRLFPNPASEYTNIDMLDIAGQAASIKLYNLFGACVETLNLSEAPATPYRLDLSGYRAGLYTVWISSPGRKPAAKQLFIKRE